MAPRPPRDIESTVTGVERSPGGLVRLTLDTGSPGLADIEPGQFVQVEVSSGPFPVTRRPFTVSGLRTRGGRAHIELVLDVVGRGTAILAEASPGDVLRVLGPLGTGWILRPGGWLLAAGGTGAAGLPFLAERVDCVASLVGARSSELLLPLSCDLELTATEDGSAGRRGLVTDLVREAPWDRVENIAICGPVGMMREMVGMVPDRLGGRVQVSVEARMGCGWGGCEGCAVPRSGGGYLRSCTEGPVVPASAVDWSSWTGPSG